MEDKQEPQPQPQQPQQQQVSPAVAVVVIVLAGLFFWFYFGGGLEQQAAGNLRDIQNQVAADAVAQYNIAARSGTAIDKCVHAGMVAAAYVQAQDEANYKNWKQQESRDCQAAGLPK